MSITGLLKRGRPLKVPVTEIRQYKSGNSIKWGLFVKANDIALFASYSRCEIEAIKTAWAAGYLEALHDMSDIGLPIFR